MRAIITDHGAVADGQTINTRAIQAAIDACAADGGGTVTVPPGTFITGTIELKSHITLCVEQGAVLRGSDSMDDYPPKTFGGFRSCPSLIFANGQTDVRITGEGLIDLNANPFMDFNQIKTAPKELGAVMNETQLGEAVVENLYRPDQPILFYNCRRVRMDGITLYNAPAWFVSANTCEDVKIHGITIDGNLQVPNNDGIHFSSCKDVIVSDCVIRCGDDCIAITGIRNWEGISERIVVSNCTMVSRSAAIRIGFLKSMVRDVIISNVIIRDSNRGVGIFAGDGGYVKNVMISNLVMETRLIAGAWWGHGEPLVISAADAPGARIEGITVDNVRAQAENPIIIVGEKKNVRDIDIRNWKLSIGYGPNRPLFKHVWDLAPAEMRPAPNPNEQIPWLYVSDAADIRLQNIKYERKAGEGREFSLDAIIQNTDKFEASNVSQD